MVLYHVPNEALKAKTSGSCIITILISHQTRTWADLDCSYSVDSKSTMPLHSACVGMCIVKSPEFMLASTLITHPPGTDRTDAYFITACVAYVYTQPR